ncbi:glycoside hydrolase family 88/105 protein [Sedimentisphaera salicampi]|uniref:glycoside hydrolase family 88/105 protein n=1 Tax=Sedimentisphaera salicampi TaxID=1941349 RepID=UPI000B9BB2ED|nr:glycoside hydrolase family 88 protein [Sedimentisphaera salicampi]OXU14503.1 Unsaturated rhamnogalacturonyl hydrolase YteR [Sedimentisphaera salicampi]
MRTNYLTVLSFCFTLLIASSSIVFGANDSFLWLANADMSVYKKEGILSTMRIANDYFMEKWPNPGEDTVTDKRRPSNIWTRGTYYEGLMALYQIEPKEKLRKKYYDYAVEWGKSHDWGMWGGTKTRNADNQCCGQTYIELYQIEPKPERIAKIKKSIDRMVSSEKIDDWNWIDAIQMAMPVFAKLGVVCGDDKYFERMYEMYSYTRNKHGDNGLYNPEHGLWWRDKDFDPPHTTPNGKNCYWSRGNGWVYAALARVLDVLPEDAPHRKEYIKDFKDMSKAIKEVQRGDGFWNVSLHDPQHFGGRELSGTAFFVYGMAWGINNSVLDPSDYMSSAGKGWTGMIENALHENGFLGYVQSTGKQPSDGQPVGFDKKPNFEDYALGAFLLAGSEIYRLAE